MEILLVNGQGCETVNSCMEAIKSLTDKKSRSIENAKRSIIKTKAVARATKYNY